MKKVRVLITPFEKNGPVLLFSIFKRILNEFSRNVYQGLYLVDCP